MGDLLLRSSNDSHNIEVKAFIANQSCLGKLTNRFDIPFYFLSHEGLSREEHSNLVKDKVLGFDSYYLILAKYIRILPPSFADLFKNKIINIHHSFLPAFIVANPYK